MLAMVLVPSEGAAVDAPSRDTEGRELALSAFVLSALADVSYRPAGALRSFRRAEPPAQITRIEVAGDTESRGEE